MREGGVGIGAQSRDGLERQVTGNGLGGLETRLESLLSRLGSRLEFGEDFFRLLDALFGKGTDLLNSLGCIKSGVVDKFVGLFSGLGHRFHPSLGAAFQKLSYLY